jgi:hypothetical protein
MHQFLAHLPYYALLLDSERHIIASNEGFLADNKLADVSELFGKGPGDIFQCENSKEAGCGKSSNCQFCGIFRTIADCLEKNAPVSHTSRLMVNRDGFLMAYEFKTRCSPLNLKGNRYYLLTLSDLSTETRKKDLERIFFHDILNMVSGLKGLSELMAESADILEMREYVDTLKEITERMSDTVFSQRDLMHAEMRELAVSVRQVSAREILNSVLDNSNFISSAGAGIIQIKVMEDDFSFSTDPSLLLRVLINMVKNALEAPNTKPGVLISCSQSDNTVLFSVHNHAYISNADARGIFKPMQSAKGSGRGLGTYSIRLISENYLKGKVSFQTHPEEGTYFTVQLPADLKN